MKKLKVSFNSKKRIVKIKMKTSKGDRIKFKYDIRADSIDSPEVSRAMSIIETLRKR